MANAQLVDYIKQQLQLGVTKEVIKATLAQAGWPESEINEALSASGPSPVQQSSPKISSEQVTQAAETASSAPGVTSVSSKPGISASSSSAFSQFTQKSSPFTQQSSPFIAKDIFQPKTEAVFQPESQPITSQVAKNSGDGSSLKKYLIIAGCAVVILGLAGWSIYLFLQNGKLKQEISQNSALSPALEQANSQVASLTDEKNSLAAQLAEANLEKADLILHLSFFIPPSGEATTTSLNIRGSLAGGDKKPYTLTTSRGAVLNIKNSSNKEVASVLQNLLGNEVEISGTYVPGTREITVINVNGTPVETPVAEQPVPTSTSPAAP